ncbi:exonuclease domain-containing protein [Aerococcus kribbianus]|uniref:DNA polymerase III polC-type n=1 Tax=Aerococcus kribbianus TaxID=2999064 RepID=A0A9X3JEY5_9LACT|nr:MULTISPECIES: exonuclease domain-containing protein [unclassified Aerococcus]MCZ0717649.1 exonuclease domain-containing protein [Aerococcus sp. YH-aer221]MCZ0725937.1 exonuclease domain-containing protein [Aerococcus sp. YH-aer222]
MPIRYAVLDLETTGPSYRRGDRIIQIGIVFVEAGEVVASYEQNIHPLSPIPKAISQLTGIYDKDVERAPKFDDIAEDLWEALQGTVIVAHNIQFDYRFLNASFKDLGYPDLNLDGVDTVELARVFYPMAPSYKLGEISEYLAIELENAHNALADARATSKLLMLIQDKIADLPREFFLDIKPFLHFFIRETGQHVFQWFMESKNVNKNDYYWNDFVLAPDKAKGRVFPKQFLAVDQHDNPHASIQLNSIQEAMITDLQERDKHDKFHLLSALAGTGKSLASLIGLLRHSDQGVLYLTPTTLLQDQIYEDTVPLLVDYLGRPLKVALLKSPKHFVNLQALAELKRDMTRQVDDELKRDAMILMAAMVWLTETSTGDFDELHPSLRNHLFWQRYWQIMTSYSHQESDQNLANNFYLRQFSRAKEADLTISNHAFFMAHLEELTHFTNKALIIDECHRLPEISRRNGRYQLSSHHLQINIASLWQIYTQISDKFLANPKLGQDWHDFYDWQENIQALGQQWHALSQIIDQISREDYYHSSHYQDQEIYLSPSRSRSFALEEQLHHFYQRLELVIEMTNQQLKLFSTKSTGRFSSKVWEVLKNLNQADLTIQKMLKEENAHYYLLKKQTRDDQKQTDLVLIQEKYQSKSALFAALKAWPGQVFLMSASLELMVQQDMIEKSFGLTHYHYYTYPAIFAYNKQIEAYVLNDQPSIDKLSDSQAADYIAQVVLFLLDTLPTKANKIQVMFQSQELLSQVYDRLQILAPAFTQNNVLAQNSQQSRRKIRQQFNRLEIGVLLAMYSFNEGVHFQSGANVYIMTRLPFANPRAARELAKADWAQYQGHDYFKSVALPEMLLSLQQIIGRCLHNTDDKVYLFSVDQRVIKSSYHQQIKRALPEGLRFHLSHLADVFTFNQESEE